LNDYSARLPVSNVVPEVIAMAVMQKPTDRKARWRVGIAFFFLFACVVAASYGASLILQLSKLLEDSDAREGQEALQGASDAKGIEEALRAHPQNRFLQFIATATRAADETDAALEKLSNEVAPPLASKNINLANASRDDLEALRRDLKVAEANATTLLPRYATLLKAKRDTMEKTARSLHIENGTVSRFLRSVDRQHAEIMAYTSRMLPARADFYRAYGNYVAMLAAEFGAYKVVNGLFIFPSQATVDRYNAAAQAMNAAAKRVDELEQEKASLAKSQAERWTQFVNGK